MTHLVLGSIVWLLYILVPIFFVPAHLAHLQAHLCTGAEEIADAGSLSGFVFLGFLIFAGLTEAAPPAIAEADSGADAVPAKAGAKDKAITKTAINLDNLISLWRKAVNKTEIRNEPLPYRKNKEFRLA